jgi:hypothetical protein
VSAPAAKPRARATSWTAAVAVLLALTVASLAAHSGPPFPIVSNQVAGGYDVSIWTDPDATDTGKPGGQFWVVLQPRGSTADVPAATEVTVAIQAQDRPGAPEQHAKAAPEDGHPGRQFAVLLMDHEGPFAVRVGVDGPLGHAEVTSRVDATYDLRPPPALFFVYLLPFVAIGLIWMRVLWKRRTLRRSPAAG